MGLKYLEKIFHFARIPEGSEGLLDACPLSDWVSAFSDRLGDIGRASPITHAVPSRRPPAP